MIDRTTSQIEVVRKVASNRGMTVFPQQYIYVSGPIFVKLANEFYPSCVSPTFVKKKVFPMERIKLKGPSIKLVYLASWLDFLGAKIHG